MYGQELQKMGLTKGEAKVYEAMLPLESTTAGLIVKNSGVSYSKVYNILDKLITKGLVSYSVREKTKYFQAANPVRLIEYLATQEEEAIENKKALKNILPSLQNMRQQNEKGESAEIFVGTKGLAAAYEILLENLEKGEEELFFYEYDPEYHERSLRFFEKMFVFFRKTGVQMRGIGGNGYKDTEMAVGTESFYKQRYVDFQVPGNIDIYKDMVLIINWNKPTGVLIRSKDIARNFRNYFNDIWKIAKK